MSDIENTIKGRVKNIIVEELRVKEEEVTPSASFSGDLGADSIDLVELVMALEDEFEIDIPYEDAEKIDDLQQTTDYVVAHFKS